MKNILLVGAGGFAGSVLRYLTANAAQVLFAGRYPVGTALVNVAGCLLIGLLAGLAGSRGIIGEGGRLLLITGFLGGFTTFSAFGLDTVQLARSADPMGAMLNVVIQIVLGCAAVYAGLGIARIG